MNNTQDILLQILAIISPRNGKERDVADFLTLIEMQALVDLIESLPPEKQKQVTEQFMTLPDEPQKAEKILSPYYSREQMRERLREATKKRLPSRLLSRITISCLPRSASVFFLSLSNSPNSL